MATTSLTERIKEAERQRQSDLRYLHPSKPTVLTPRWLRRLEAKDFTETIYSDGAWVPRRSGGAA